MSQSWVKVRSCNLLSPKDMYVECKTIPYLTTDSVWYDACWHGYSYTAGACLGNQIVLRIGLCHLCVWYVRTALSPHIPHIRNPILALCGHGVLNAYRLLPNCYCRWEGSCWIVYMHSWTALVQKCVYIALLACSAFLGSTGAFSFTFKIGCASLSVSITAGLCWHFLIREVSVLITHVMFTF